MSSPTLVAIKTLSRLPLVSKPVADDGFGFTARIARHPARIAVGGVDSVEAGIDKRIKQRERSLLVDGPAEHIAAKHERGEVQFGLAEAAGFHLIVAFFLVMPGLAPGIPPGPTKRDGRDKPGHGTVVEE